MPLCVSMNFVLIIFLRVHNTSYLCTKGVCDGSLIWVKKVIDAMGLRWLSDVVGKRTQISHAIDRIAIASPKMSECFEKHGPGIVPLNSVMSSA